MLRTGSARVLGAGTRELLAVGHEPSDDQDIAVPSTAITRKGATMHGAEARVGVGTRFHYDGEVVTVEELFGSAHGIEVLVRDGHGRSFGRSRPVAGCRRVRSGPPVNVPVMRTVSRCVETRILSESSRAPGPSRRVPEPEVPGRPLRCRRRAGRPPDRADPVVYPAYPASPSHVAVAHPRRVTRNRPWHSRRARASAPVNTQEIAWTSLPWYPSRLTGSR